MKPVWTATTQEIIPDLIVIELRDEVSFTLSQLSAIQKIWPTIPIVGYMAKSSFHTVLGHLPGVIRAGISDVVFEGQENIANTIVQILQRTPHWSLSTAFERELLKIPSLWVTRFCQHCLKYPLKAVTVTQVVSHMGGTRQYIAHEFRKLGMCIPGDFLTGARLLHTARVLSRNHTSSLNIVYSLGWVSTDAFRHALMRHVGLSTATASTSKGWNRIFEHVRSLLTVWSCS